MPQTAETFDRARLKATEIDNRTVNSDVRMVPMTGVTSGRDSDPYVFHGHAVRYIGHHGTVCLMFWPDDTVRDALKGYYVVDGVPMYVAGWQGSGNGSADLAPSGYVLLHTVDAPSDRWMPGRVRFMRTNGTISKLGGEPY